MLRRNGVFSVRIHVPVELRDILKCREVWRSTQTRDPRTARLRASQWRHHFGTLFLQLRKAGRSMAQSQLAGLVAQYLEAHLQEVEERIAHHLPQMSETDRNVWLDTLAEQLSTIELQLMHGDYSQTEAEAHALLPAEIGVAVPMLARRLLEARFDALKAELDSLNGKPLRRVQMVAKVAQEDAAEAPRVTPRLSAVFRDYISTTRVANNGAPKTLASREQAAHLLIDFLDDCPIGDVTRKTMTEAYLLLARMPAHHSKRYKGLRPKAAIEAADKLNDTKRVSPKSCNLRLEVWKSLFRYASQNDTIPKTLADHLNAFAEGKAQDARDAFTEGNVAAEYASTLRRFSAAYEERDRELRERFSGGSDLASAEVFCADARVKLREVPKASVNLVVTSPPSFGVSDYVKAQRLSMEWFGEEIEPFRRNEIGARSKRHRQESMNEYLSEIGDVFSGVRNCLRSGSACVIVLGESSARSPYISIFVERVLSCGFDLLHTAERKVSAQRRLTPSILHEQILVFGT